VNWKTKVIVAACGAWLVAALTGRCGTVKYAYDDAGRLTGADYGGGRTIVYVYDAMGNLLQRVVQAGGAQAEVAIRKTGEMSSFELGRANLVYWLAVSNAGPQAAENVRVSDMLPSRTLFARASAGAVSGGVYQVSLGGLPAGAESRIRLELVPLDTGTFVNTASVTNDIADSDPADNISVFTNVVLLPADTNANGLADWWENYYFTNPADRVATADYDRDGVINLHEYIALTDPISSNSFLKISALSGGGSRAIEFDTASGRVYCVDWIRQLAPGLWENLQSNIPGVGLRAVVSDTNTAGQRIYRLQATVP
jgi:uncharacterized repeat protein (TIGR01451 family)